MIEAFAVVPPMSKVMRLGSSSRLPRWKAPTTPAAGPDSMQYIGFSVAMSKGIRPPFDCITVTGTPKPMARSPSPSRRRYSSTTGRT